MIKKPISKRTSVLLGVLAVACALGFYAYLSHAQHVKNPKDTTIPNFVQFVDGIHKIFIKNEENFTGGFFWADTFATYTRFFSGMFIGVSVSYILGLMMGCYPKVAAFSKPLIMPFAKIPPTAMMAIYLVVFGTGYKLYPAMIALGILPSLAMSLYQSIVKDVDEHTLSKTYTLGATNFDAIWEVVRPQTFPRFLQAIQLAVGPALVFLIAAEWVFAHDGYGYRLRMESRMLNMNVVYTYLLILGITGYFIDNGIGWFRKRFYAWYGE